MREPTVPLKSHLNGGTKRRSHYRYLSFAAAVLEARCDLALKDRPSVYGATLTQAPKPIREQDRFCKIP
jgi:hypothetical protein